MIRTKDYLYIRNYNPDRWPSGIDRLVTNEGPYGDVDRSPTKDYMLKHKEAGKGKALFELAFGKRPAEELYDCGKDPFQMHNLADSPAHHADKQRLSRRLTAYLKKTHDPREASQPVSWDDWPYYGRKDWTIRPEAE